MSSPARVTFQVDGQQVVGYWHFPAGVPQPMPAVLMGHGFAALWQFATAPIIEAFNAAGWAVFSFDYRHFGESEGKPRQLVNVAKQLADWQGALQQVRGHEAVDAGRIALWGSSFGGGHALTTAAGAHDVAAVVAQVPHCDGRHAGSDISAVQGLGIAAHLILDLLAACVGRCHTIPVVAGPGQTGALPYPGWREDYLALVPPGANWRNALPARSLLSVGRYHPVDICDRIRCPVLFIYGSDDPGIPVATVEAAAARMPDAHLAPYEGGHFDVYQVRQPEFIAQQVAFLRPILGPGPGQ